MKFNRLIQKLMTSFGCCAVVLLFAAKAWSADILPVIVEGDDIPEEMSENIQSYIGDIDKTELKNWKRTQEKIFNATRDALQALGYYSPVLDASYGDSTIQLNVVLNAPVKIRSMSIRFLGDAGNDIAFTALRESLPIQEGMVFNHGAYERTKKMIQDLASERGYFDGEWQIQRVDVNVENAQADIQLLYLSGSRYTFGKVSFFDKNNVENPAFLKPNIFQKFINMMPDESYDANKVIAFNKSLLDSRYFSSVKVISNRDQRQSLQVPISAIVAVDDPNNMDLGVGYSTDIRERISLKWARPRVNASGHSITTNIIASPVSSSLDAKYNIPLTHPLNDIAQFFYGVKREVLDSNKVNWNTLLGVQRIISRTNDWQQTYSLRWLRDTSESFNNTTKKDLLMPGLSLSRTRSLGGFDPYWGDRQFYQVELASKSAFSDADFIVLRGGWRLLRTYASRHQLSLRLDLGGLLTKNFEDVPVSSRFFAGGDQSIRGFAYKSLPVVASNEQQGARYLLTNSIEYNYFLTKKWRLALFTDSGKAFNNSEDAYKVGSGTGVRWISPVGPVRLDFAWAVSEPNNPFRIHFSMGAPL
jgi:translocation and assembly module TamA